MTITETINDLLPKTGDGHVSVTKSVWNLVLLALAAFFAFLMYRGHEILGEIKESRKEDREFIRQIDGRVDSLESDRNWIKQAQAQAAIDHERRLTNLENDLLNDVMSAYSNMSKRFDTLIDKVQVIERKVDVLESRSKP